MGKCFIRHSYNGQCVCTKCGKRVQEDMAAAYRDLSQVQRVDENARLDDVLRLHKWDGCTCTVCGLVNPESQRHTAWKPRDKGHCECAVCGKVQNHTLRHKAKEDKCVQTCTACGYEKLPGGEHNWIGCMCTKCRQVQHNVVGCTCADCHKEFHAFVLVKQEGKNDSEDRFRWRENTYRCERCGKEKVEEEPL